MFIGLWNYADDHGRGRDDARLICAELFALDDDKTPAEVEKAMKELARKGRIIRYTVNGKKCFEITNWSEHQKPNKPVDSKIPALSDADEVQVTGANESSKAERTEGERRTHVERTSVEVEVEVEVEVDEARNSDERNAPTQAPDATHQAQILELPPSAPKAKPPDELTAVIAQATNTNLDEMTERSRGTFFSAVADIRRVGATPDQVKARAIAYRRKFAADVPLTAAALAKHWPSLGGDPLAAKSSKRDIEGAAWIARKQAEERATS